MDLRSHHLSGVMSISHFHMLALVLLTVLVARSSAEGCSDPTYEGCSSDETHNAHLSMLQTALEVTKAVATNHNVPKKAPKVTAANYHTPTNRAEAAGVKMNAEGDLSAFVTSLFTNVFMVLFCVGIFVFLKERYPKTYSRNLETNPAPLNNPIEPGWTGWFQASLAADTESVINSAGLDMAMLLEFSNLGMRIFTIIGVPMFCIMGPVNCIFGGHNAGNDKLSYFSFGNVVNGSNLYWIHALCVWGVVFAVRSSIFSFHEKFLQYRYQWLRDLPAVRAQTIMVEGIPESDQSDGKLKSFFEKMFGAGCVAATYIVKDAPDLEAACANRDAKKDELAAAAYKAKAAADENKSPEEKKQLLDNVKNLEVELASLQRDVKSLQEGVRKKAGQAGAEGFNTSAGFVTFAKRSDAAFALSVQFSEDYDEWEVSAPPDPSSVLWRDLQQGSSKSTGFTLLGYGLTLALFFAYMPLVVWMTQIAVKINMGPLQSLWAAFAPTIGLQIMVAFLPTFLILIFRFCFTLKADVFAQLTLQHWYFLFQLVFVVLVTAIGGSVEQFLETLAETPLKIFTLLGSTMPNATHFYMIYIMLQWTTHAMVLMRYVQLGKYLIFQKVLGEESALALSEPEDQDYYGIGSRSARMSIIATLGIVYGTLCPPINILAFAEFYLNRVIYGYLLPFAESRKPDTGGHFWVGSLHNVFTGTLLYCLVMVGVLIGRASTNGPAILAAPSIAYVVWSARKLERSFLWERLPMKELMEAAPPSKTKQDLCQYVQPMLL